ncbi:MAG: ATP-binding protein [Bdellovibrionales bacterium]|jgi:signal transduction histidine kinase|nr:ATP-binding protein [Bdellovibrionales bacterium]
MKIRTRLLIFNCILMLVTAMTFAGAFFIFGERYLAHLATEEVTRSGRQALYTVEQFFETRASEQAYLSKSTYFFRELNLRQIQSRFEDYRRNFKTYESISFYDRNRIRRIDLNRLDLGRKTKHDHLFDRAMTSDHPVYQFDMSNPVRPMVHFVSKIREENGPLIGFVFMTIPLASLQRTLSTLTQPVTGQIRTDVQIFARDGSRIYSRLESLGTPDERLLLSSLASLTSPKSIDTSLFAPGEVSLQSRPLKNGGVLHESEGALTLIFERGQSDESENPAWTLAFRVMKDDLQKPIVLLRKLILTMLATLLLVAFALNRWLVRSLFMPLERLTLAMKNLGLGRLETKIETDSTDDEIGFLTRGVHDMTERFKTDFAELNSTSKFTALGEMAVSIAHEINNPLTVIMGKAAMLNKAAADDKVSLDRPSLQQSSTDIMDMVNRITKTIHSLRVYSRSGDSDPIGAENIQAIIDSTLQICLERLRLASIQVQVTITPHDAIVLARPVQISQILMNLINNAHDAIIASTKADDTSARWIHITATESDRIVEIIVENGGPKIPDHIIEKLFDPFFTTKPPGVGTGIGLTISRRLAQANHADLTLDRSAAHTRFVLTFSHPHVQLASP